jgi:hypothetical protein
VLIGLAAHITDTSAPVIDQARPWRLEACAVLARSQW